MSYKEIINLLYLSKVVSNEKKIAYSCDSTNSPVITHKYFKKKKKKKKKDKKTKKKKPRKL